MAGLVSMVAESSVAVAGRHGRRQYLYHTVGNATLHLMHERATTEVVRHKRTVERWDNIIKDRG